MAHNDSDSDRWPIARTTAPAKLNLFLELLGRRDDGYHEIDTIMVPIDWHDEIVVQRNHSGQIRVAADWLPSQPVLANRLGRSLQCDSRAQLALPQDQENLVYKALALFRDRFDSSGGFDCQINKRIPAGAGMGGASSDAASALRCAAKLYGVENEHEAIYEIAKLIGSDVPFFLGCADGTTKPRTFAARATGRGEILSPLTLRCPLNFVVAFPGECLSTAKVYAASHLAHKTCSPEGLLAAFQRDSVSQIAKHLFNRLSEPAQKILPRIDEILNSMWRCGLQACQLTGSGSACFAIQSTAIQSDRGAKRLRAMLEPGALIAPARSVCVPTPVICD